MSQAPTPEHEARSDEAKPDYEAPSVEEIDVEDSPAVTAAGVDITGDTGGSDIRLKHSVRSLGGEIIRGR